MDGICIEYVNRQTYKYNYTYSLPHSNLNNGNDYIYFRLLVGTKPFVDKPTDEKTERIYAEIGIIDKENLSLYPCKVRLGHVYIKAAEAIPESLSRSRAEDTLYNFSCYLYDTSFSDKREFMYIGTVHEFAGCCQVLNYFVDNGFDINNCRIDKLRNKYRHYATQWGIEAYTMLDIYENIQFTDFLDYISSAENKAYESCKYNYRRGEYAHDYWETLTFITDNLAFSEIVESVLHKDRMISDNHFVIEYEFKAQTDYGGGISIMTEKEGTKEVKPIGDFKKETIKKIINTSCRNYPSDLFIICKLISV